MLLFMHDMGMQGLKSKWKGVALEPWGTSKCLPCSNVATVSKFRDRSCLQADVKSSAVQAILTRLQAGLLPALKGGEQGGTLHARRLMTALQACPSSKLTALLMLGPSSAACWAAMLCRCFAFERSAAALLMHNTSRAGPHATIETSCPHDTSETESCVSSTTEVQKVHQAGPGSQVQQQGAAAQSSQQNPAPSSNEHQPHKDGLESLPAAKAGHSSQPEAVSTKLEASSKTASLDTTLEASSKAALWDTAHMETVLLPRMALGLTHITSQATYAAVAGVARTLGHAAARADHDSPDSTGTDCKSGAMLSVTFTFAVALVAPAMLLNMLSPL